MSVSKNARDVTMKTILDFYYKRETGQSIGLEYIQHKGLPDNANAFETIEVLKSMGLITYEKWKDGTIHNIVPSGSGLSYFEREEDEKAEKKKAFNHDWKIAIFSALVGALASEPLWKSIRFLANIIQTLFQNQGNIP